jgi:serine/threonine-protein kinase
MRNEDSKRRASRPTSLVGTVLSRKWHIERLLGSGGMSSVYSATHRNGKRVAIKVLSPELSASARFRTRFLREGYIANRVGHAGAAFAGATERERGGSA